MMSTRELIENYTAYTNALELNHSTAADATARTTPFCVSVLVSAGAAQTFDASC